MADVVWQYYTSATTTKEDILDVVTNISPEDTPFLSMCQTAPDATSRVHQFPTDTLGARTSTVAVEGFSFSGTTLVGRTRLTNYTEIRHRNVSVSDSARAMDNIGTTDEFAYQMTKATKQLAIHFENSLWGTSTGYSGAAATGAQCKSILPWISTNKATATATRTITTDLVNGVLQSCWTAGGNPDYIFCGPARKVGLSGIISTAYGERQVTSGAGGTIAQYVDVYMGDFGTQKVVLSRDIETDTYAFLEMQRWAVSWLTGRRPQMKPIGRRGDKTEAYVVGEFTLEARAENASGKLEDIG
jgi:hypothetical protein